MKRVLTRSILVTIATLLSVACTPSHEGDLQQALDRLDEALILRGDVAEIKDAHIAIHRTTLENKSLSYEQQLFNVEKLIGLYYKYQLDSTIVWLQRGITLASQAGDTAQKDSFKLQTSYIYSTAGLYDEASSLLQSVDTTRLNSATLELYYAAQHSYNRELREYSPDPTIREHATNLEEYYMNLLIGLESDSLERHKYLCVKYCNLGKWEKVPNELDHILPILDPDSQEFAYYTYFKALSVGDNRGTPEEFATHLARSARADMMSCTRDYASLSMLSEMLFHMGDVERAFHYIKIAMEDASFYNSRLRPWQVATLMPVIEKSYSDKVNKQQFHLTIAVILISVLSAITLLFLFLNTRHTHQLKQTKRQLEGVNRRLEEYIVRLSEQNAKEHTLSAELLEANTVKEQYIGLFLVICSDYIDILKSYHNNVLKKLSRGSADSLRKELEVSKIVQQAEEDFYVNFDNAFLNLYPTFVEEFNTLLREECQITLKKPHTLNTELRIFALIKLGITDSSRIASLLRYSVNTIYNYRSGVKNKAKVLRNDFEDSIKQIGTLRH